MIFTALEKRLLHSRGGTIGGWIAGGVPVLLLTTTGRRTGRRRSTPLLFHREADGSFLLIAANGAADWNPDWFYNLEANAEAQVEVDGERIEVVASVLSDSERNLVWEVALRAFPSLGPAQRATKRDIPLVRLAARPS